jgi:hypothetical protein
LRYLGETELTWELYLQSFPGWGRAGMGFGVLLPFVLGDVPTTNIHRDMHPVPT